MMERMFLLNGRTLLAKVAENWPAKVISIAMAIVLFVFHRMSLLEERFFSVPLSIETDTQLIPASPYPGMIKITLRGDANTIYPILEEDIRAYIDLSKYTEPGTYRAPVQIHKKGTSLRAEALEIFVDPLEVVLILDERLSKTVPVKVNFRGTLEMGYEMGEYTLDPAHVVIDGPMGLLKDISELSTDVIELTGRSVDFSTTVRILNDEPLIVIRGNGLIDFHGTIREQLRIQNIEDIPIKINGLDEQFSGELEITIGSVRIEGGQTMFDKLKAQDIGLYVDCFSINDQGDFLLPVFVLFPAMFTLIRQDPKNVMIHIRRLPSRIIGSGGP
jgi:YbbR domain-containing protein